jgi:hypothetical protein
MELQPPWMPADRNLQHEVRMNAGAQSLRR